ncbi:MAG: general secretion pathway protein GspM, partial [Rhodanobacter sp.]|nr:general secretion pathway protein GspM [Rhodanobacter sp.]
MRMVQLTPRQSRLAAVALLLLSVVLGYFVLLHWWFVAPLEQLHADMAYLRGSQSRYAAAIAEKPA